MPETVKSNRLAPVVFPEASSDKTEASEWIVARPLTVLAKMARSRGLDWVRMKAAYGLVPGDLDDQDRKLNVHDVICLFEEVAQAIGDDAAILNEFSTLPQGYAYTFDYVGLLAPSLRDALRNWQRFYPLHSNSVVLQYSEDNDYGVLQCRLPDGNGTSFQATYAFVAWIAGRIELVLGTIVEQIRLEFAAPAPKQSCRFLEKYANRTHFGRTENRILIPVPLLDSRPPKADGGLLKIIVNAAERDMQDRSREVSPLPELDATVEYCLRSGDFSMGHVASIMGLTQKALQRALERKGTCFRHVLENARSSMAGHYLTQTNLPIKEIAYLLGFSEASAFSRAVKRWFGQPPRAIREQSGDRPSGS